MQFYSKTKIWISCWLVCLATAGSICTIDQAKAAGGGGGGGGGGGLLSVTPAEPFLPTGNTGGPFAPSFKEYTITNTGGTTIDYSASVTQNWLDVSPTSGTLPSNNSATITISVNSNANTKGAGLYNDTIAFTNVTSGGQPVERNVTLTVNSMATNFDWNKFLPTIVTNNK